MEKRYTHPVKIKARLWFISLRYLFVLLFLLAVDISVLFSLRNVAASVFLGCAAAGRISRERFRYRLAGVRNPPYRIKSVKKGYYGNPAFLLMGYRTYLAEIEGAGSPEGIILVTKDRLSAGVSVRWREIYDSVWIADIA